jgi:Tetratricopeptide repeat
VTARTWPGPGPFPGDGQRLYHAVILGDNIMISGVGGNVTITTERPPYIVESFPTGTDTVSVADARARPGQLLLARNQVVPFAGRNADLRRVAAWMATSAAVSTLLIHAAGGQGKTRLAAHVAKKCADAGWAVWRVLHETTFSGGYRMEMPVGGGLLAVVDYADRWPVSHLLDLTRHMTSMNLQTGLRIRVLLLARSARGWWPAFRNRLVNTHRIAASALALQPLGEQVNRSKLYREACRHFGVAMEVDGTDNLPLPIRLTEKAFGQVLTLHMAALVAVDAHYRNAAVPSELHALSSYLLLREHDHWHALHARDEQPIKASPEVMARTVYVATLTGALRRQTARTALKSVGLAAEDPAADSLIDEHRFCYPPDDAATVLQELRPDRLGEDLIALSTPGHPYADDDDAWQVDDWSLTAPELLLIRPAGETPLWTSRGVTVLVEAARRWPHIAANVLYPLIRQQPALAIDAGGAALVRLAGIPDIDPTMLELLEAMLPVERHIDLDVAAAAISTVLTRYRLSRATQPAEQAQLHASHSLRLTAAGQHESAIVAAEEATRIYRRLVKANPGPYLPDFAASLSDLGMILSRLGRLSDALAAAEEAAAIRRQLAQTDPASYLPNLATALNNLSNRLSALGRRREALAPADEAVSIRRRLAKADPSTYLPRLATALTNLGNRLSELGRYQDALAPAEEAVEIGRELAQANPAAYLPDLAMSLSNLGNRLYELGRRENTLAAAQEATAIRRQLAQVNPAVHEPDFAMSLNNVAAFLSGLDRHDEALVLAEEAAGIYRRLAADNPAAQLHNLAMALNNIPIFLANLGRDGAALAPAEEATGIYRRLAEANPGAYLSEFATSLANLGNRLSVVGRREDSLAAAKEAVTISRQLARENPGTHEADLAKSLSAYAWGCVKLGMELQGALSAAEEAITLYEPLAERLPRTFGGQLLLSYRTYARILDRLGRTREAAVLLRVFDQKPGE